MDLDEIDQKILQLLRSDGRMSNRDIAERLSLAEATVGNRLRKLFRENAVRVIAVADFGAFALDFMMSIGIEVQGRPVERVAQEVAALPAVLSCNIVVGRHDIQLIAAVENAKAAADLIEHKLAGIQGVYRISSSLISEVLKYNVDTTGPARGFLEAFHTPSHDTPAALLDDKDVEILRHLWHDARETNQTIADDLKITEGTVRGRVKRMIADGAIRIQAISNITASGRPTPTLALLELRVDPKKVNAAAQALSDLKATAFVAKTFGTYDITVLLFAETREHLGELFLKHVRNLEGVREIEASYPIQFAKFDYRFGRVKPRPSGPQKR